MPRAMSSQKQMKAEMPGALRRRQFLLISRQILKTGD
jgi:hypothetical protein